MNPLDNISRNQARGQSLDFLLSNETLEKQDDLLDVID